MTENNGKIGITTRNAHAFGIHQISQLIEGLKKLLVEATRESNDHRAWEVALSSSIRGWQVYATGSCFKGGYYQGIRKKYFAGEDPMFAQRQKDGNHRPFEGDPNEPV